MEEIKQNNHQWRNFTLTFTFFFLLGNMVSWALGDPNNDESQSSRSYFLFALSMRSFVYVPFLSFGFLMCFVGERGGFLLAAMAVIFGILASLMELLVWAFWY